MSDASPGWIRRHRLAVGLLSGGVVVAVAGVIGAGLLFGTTTIPISVSEAIDRFRGKDSASADAGEGTASLPEPGVYSYGTTGRESVVTFLSAARDYPVESTITVTRTDCGVRMEWTPLRERTEFMEVCPVEGGVALVRYGGAHEFFGMRDEYSLDCPAGAWLVPPSGTTDVEPVTCAGGNLQHVRSTTMLGPRSVLIGGVEVEGVRVITEIATSGAMNGTITTTKVIGPGGLILSWGDEVDGLLPSPVGDVTYKESFTLSLSSLTPAR